MRNVGMKVGMAVVAAGAMGLGGCIQDDSMPTRPRTSNPFVNPDEAERAEQRALERQDRSVPTGGLGDAPRQLNKAKGEEGRQVATLMSRGPDGRVNCPIADMFLTPDDYQRDLYNNGPIPHLPAGGTTAPMPGGVQVPGSPWVAEFSLGQGLALTEAPHRSWPETKAYYEVANVKHNPVYYMSVSPRMGANGGGTYNTDWVANIVEIPWFYINTAMVPFLMLIEPPLAQVTTERVFGDPVFNGHLPETGVTVPSPIPGQLKWEYPFLNPDGSIKARNVDDRNTPAPAPTPGVTPVRP